MMMLMIHAMNVVAQAMPPQPWEEPEAPKTVETARRLTFGDLQKSVNSQFSGETNEAFYRNALIIVVLGVVVIAVVMNFYQRRKNAGAPDSVSKLGWELSRAIRFPFGSRVMLWWVARSTKVPVAVLLISGEIFEASVDDWSRQPTFSVIREWGVRRLQRLQALLFSADHALQTTH